MYEITCNVSGYTFRRGTVQPVLSKHLRNIQNMLAKDRCMLNAGIFLCICLFGELNICLLNTSCLLDRSGH